MIKGLALVSLCAAAACAHHDPNGDGDGKTDAPPAPPDSFAGPFSDFPTGPIIDDPTMMTPADSSTLFGDPTTGAATGGPCLFEPEVNTVYPRNWIRPRFTWLAGAGENLFELRITTPTQVNALVVYTTATQWTMPQDIWNGLTSHSVNTPLTVAIRGGAFDGTQLTSIEHGSTGDISIAPVDAPGAIVYWTTSQGTKLNGFHIGDESVKNIITTADTGTQCIGCHSSTPDGDFVGFSATQTANNGDPAFLGMMSSDGTHTTPSYITTTGQTLMNRVGQELPVYTKMHWTTGDRIVVSMFPAAARDAANHEHFDIAWTDLEATSAATGTGTVARTGDTYTAMVNNAPMTLPSAAASATFAHTTDSMLYVSAPDVHAGITVTQGKLMTVPYGNRAGGVATPITTSPTGTTFNEYYPVYSPDDAYVAFNRVPTGESSYNNAHAEVCIVPAAGSTTPKRLAANDPPACTAKASPGVTNSWPKWAPAAT
ncbi:MAG TPA: hypothetical protein VGC41_28590, partial [Kofleriaceae bacterium]